jgi:hypothetical protein
MTIKKKNRQQGIAQSGAERLRFDGSAKFPSYP